MRLTSSCERTSLIPSAPCLSGRVNTMMRITRLLLTCSPSMMYANLTTYSDHANRIYAVALERYRPTFISYYGLAWENISLICTSSEIIITRVYVLSSTIVLSVIWCGGVYMSTIPWLSKPMLAERLSNLSSILITKALAIANCIW